MKLNDLFLYENEEVTGGKEITLSDSRSPEITLKMLNRLKKMNSIKDLEKAKKKLTINKVYGTVGE